MKFITVLLLICISLTNNYANNILINNVSLTGQNLENGFALLEFDVSWDNSWRLESGPSNYDAAWVFVKYRESGGNWQHASINYVDGNMSFEDILMKKGNALPPRPETPTRNLEVVKHFY